jgi:hypothetical protein
VVTRCGGICVCDFAPLTTFSMLGIFLIATIWGDGKGEFIAGT